jgi:hypothetical protein
MKELLEEMERFLSKAMKATYAGGGAEVDTEEPGFTDLEFKEGKWYYKDSYTGFFQSWGRETVWLDGKPFWTQVYGGGMSKKFQNDKAFAHKTFDFLKKALSKKENAFQPRGPKKFADGDWKYVCTWKGDLTKFSGSEKISFKGEVVFVHDFIGGLVLAL